MINLNDIYSVTDFQRNAKAILGKLRAGKSPAVLTVNGKAEFVLQDARSYQELLDRVRAADDLNAVREGLRQSLVGEGTEAGQFFVAFEQEHGL
jgi:PHD/YefM family antitoxin component YafN of YafNO toxin-antitoxin module